MAKKKIKTVMTEIIKPEVKAFLFCEFVVQDKKNRFSLINIFDRIHFKKLPSPYPVRMFISLVAPEGEYAFRLVAENPGEKPNEIAKITVNVGRDNIFNIALDGIVTFDYFGHHFFAIYVNGEIMGKAFLTVVKIED